MINMISVITFLANILPDPPVGTPNILAEDGIEFFGLWISRIGGFIAFIGAIKFALSINTEDAKEKLQGILTMVSGFMIRAAVNELSIFNIPTVYTDATANAEFTAIMNFISSWIRRVGVLGLFIGAIMVGLAIKDNNAVTKITGLKTLGTGAIIASISAILPQFV